jgi:exonuclease III
MAGFDETDPFLRAFLETEKDLPSQVRAEQIVPPEPTAWAMPAGPSAAPREQQPEHRDPVRDTNPRARAAVLAVIPNNLPEHVPTAAPQPESWSSTKKGVAAVAAAAVVFALLGWAAKHNTDNEQTTAGAHHGRLHHNGKAHHGTQQTGKNATIHHTTASASPEPHKIKGYLLTNPSPTVPSSSEAPTTTPTPTQAPVHVGAASLKFATFNVHGAIHTAARGPQSGANRAKKQAEFIMRHNLAVTAHQEFERPQRKTEMNVLPSNYKVFPKKAQYGVKTSKINSVNSIVYDTDQVKFIKAKSLPMIYFHGWHYKIPLVEFESVDSHQKFWVANTHDPAHPQYAKYRWADALEHAEDAREIVARHKSLIFLGDFNSGYHKRTQGNITYLGQPKNLTVNIMEDKGHMVDAIHALDGKKGRHLRAKYASGPGIVDHGFVSKDLSNHVTDYEIISHGTYSDHSVVDFTIKFPPKKKHHRSQR